MNKHFNIEDAEHESDLFYARDCLIWKLEIDKKELQDRIDKAIEYIENEFDEVGCCVSGSDLPYSYIDELLDILKGKDNND